MVQYVSMNIDLTLNTAVTNGLGSHTDAVLIINDNNSWEPQDTSVFPMGGTCDPSLGTGSFKLPDPRYPCPQKATLTGPSTLTWNGVQFPVPGAPNDLDTLPLPNPSGVPGGGIPICLDFFNQTSTDSCFDLTTTTRFTNVRGNAAALGAGGTVIATLGVTAFASISVQSNSGAVGIILVGLLVSYGDGITGLQCEDFWGQFLLHLEEGFAAAFKTLGAPSFANSDNATENGYPVLVCNRPSCAPQPVGGTGGGATQATRFILRFFNIPMGVTLFVWDVVDTALVPSSPCTVTEGGGPLCIERVSGTDENGAGGTTVTSATPSEVALDSGGNGFVVYELKEGDPFLPQEIWVHVDVHWETDTSEDKPFVGSGQVDARFAPLSDVGVASVSDPRPRFVDVGGDPFTFVTVVRCATTLLFPFVTNRFGFDTGIAVSNTSYDWKGTPKQRGRCMVHYIGKVGDDGPMPDTATSTIVEGGEQMTFTLSAGNPIWSIDPTPDFQGFLVIMCEFQFAHGYAFITDGGAGIPTLAQGYLALVLQFGSDGNRIIDCHRAALSASASADAMADAGPPASAAAAATIVGCPSEALNH